MASTIRFQGAEELKAKFKAMAEDARKNTLKNAVDPAAEYVKEAIFARAPVRTGFLASHLSTVHVTETADRFVTCVAIDPAAYYWRYLEFGTSRMPARPFIRPAFYSARAQARAEMRDGIRDGVLGFTE